MALNQTILPKADRDTVIVAVYSLLAEIGATEIISDMIITYRLTKYVFILYCRQTLVMTIFCQLEIHSPTVYCNHYSLCLYNQLDI